MTLLAVIDTNIVVAGLLTSRAEAPVARVLDGMLAARFPFALSEALLTEYRSVLLRRKLTRLHALNAAEIDTLLTELVTHAILINPAAGPPAPDAGDQLLWDLLASRHDLQLVTGDKRLFTDAKMAPRVLTAAEFLGKVPF